MFSVSKYFSALAILVAFSGCGSVSVPVDDDADTVCAAGQQDEDNNGTCLDDCETAALDCGTGACEIAAGVASCSCDEFSEGDNCEACTDEAQDNDGDGVCAASCASNLISCGARTVCADESGEAECVCQPGFAGLDCATCAPGFEDDNGDGNCRSCSNAAPFDAAFGSRIPMVFSNLSTEVLPAGTPVEFVFDHAAVVAAGSAQESGADLRVVLADGSDTVLVHGLEVGPNLPNTRVVFPLQADMAPGETTVDYWLYFGNPDAQALPEVFTPAFEAAAVAVDDQAPLACIPRFANFLSIQLRQIDNGVYEVNGREHTQDKASFGRISIIDNEQAGAEVFNTSFSELGGSCCSPVVDGFLKESVDLASRDFTVTMTSDEFSGSNRFYGCTVFGTGSGVPPGSETRRYTVVDNARLKASVCGQ